MRSEPPKSQQGPRNRPWPVLSLSKGRAAGAAAPEGLEPAAPSLPAQAWTGDRGEASRELRPARPRALHGAEGAV